MPKESAAQKKTMERVLHEYKHGELDKGRGGKVKSRKQAIAIGLKEAGASKYASKDENVHNFRHTKEKERKGETARQQKEGA